MARFTVNIFSIIIFGLLSILAVPPEALAANYRIFQYFEGLPDDYKEKGYTEDDEKWKNWQGCNYHAIYLTDDDLDNDEEEGKRKTLYGYPKKSPSQLYTCVGWKDGQGNIIPAKGDINRVTIDFSTKDDQTVQKDSSITWIYKKAHEVTFNVDPLDQSWHTWGDNGRSQLGGDNANAVETVAAGYWHTVAIDVNGRLWAWGRNHRGQLGDGSIADKHTATRIRSDTIWKAVAAGADHSVAIDVNGGLWAWGHNHRGQLGDGTTDDKHIPTQIVTTDPSNDSPWVGVAAGYYHTVAIKANGTLWAWGANAYGQLGDNSTTDSYVPKIVENTIDWATVAAGAYHSVAIDVNGGLWAWGRNHRGQLGDGTQVDKDKPTTVNNTTPIPWASVAARHSHTVAIKADGTLWAWGWNAYGQLGDGTQVDKNEPAQIGSGTTWASVAAGESHTVAIKEDAPTGKRTLWAWGRNHHGQLGDGTTDDKHKPGQIGSDTDWNALAGGQFHTVAIKSDKSDQTLWAWGYNYFRQLGDGTTDDKNEPKRIWLLVYVSVAAAADHTLGIRHDGTLWAWGYNAYGQLGFDPGIFSKIKTPSEIKPGFTFVSVAAGSRHTVAIKSDGTLLAWGRNDYGQLGNGTKDDEDDPTQIGEDDKWVSVSAGRNHTVAIKSDGTLWAWGEDEQQQLGNGEEAGRQLIPIQIGEDEDWVSVAAGEWHTVAIKKDGSLWAWGRNDRGQLGVGNENDTRHVPTEIVIGPPATWLMVDAGLRNTFAIRTDGTLWGWGANYYGQLGNGSTEDKYIPTQIKNDNNWVWVAAGNGARTNVNEEEKGGYTVAIKSDGTLWAWGANDYGQLGDGTTVDKTTPTEIKSNNNWISVAAGYNHTVAIQGDVRFDLKPHLGTRYLPESDEPIIASARAIPFNQEEAVYSLITSWEDGTGDVEPEGNAYGVQFSLTQPISLTWKYEEVEEAKKLTVAIRGLPLRLLEQAAPNPSLGSNLFGEDASISLLVKNEIADGADLWRCLGWELWKNGSVSKSDTGCEKEINHSDLGEDSSFIWKYGLANAVNLMFEGLPVHLQGLKNFPVTLKDDKRSLQAPNHLPDRAAPVRYVLYKYSPDVKNPNATQDDVTEIVLPEPVVVKASAYDPVDVKLYYRKELRLKIDLAVPDGKTVPMNAVIVKITDVDNNETIIERPENETTTNIFTYQTYYKENSSIEVSVPKKLTDDVEYVNLVDLSGTTAGTTPLEQGTGDDARMVLTFNLTKPTDLVGNYLEARSWTIGEGISPPTWVITFNETGNKPQIDATGVDGFDGTVTTHTVREGSSKTEEIQKVTILNATQGSIQCSFTLNNQTSTADVAWDASAEDAAYVLNSLVGVTVKKWTGASTPFVNVGTTNITDNAFYWDAEGKKLYPIRPVVSADLTWKNLEDNDVSLERGYAMWPDPSNEEPPDTWPERQESVVNAPANLQPAGSPYTFEELMYSGCSFVIQGEPLFDEIDGVYPAYVSPSELDIPANRPAEQEPIFKPTTAGQSLLRFSQKDGSLYFVVVNTEDLPDTLPPEGSQVGKEIMPSDHNDPEGKNGYVYYENAYYDGHGPDKAYDRENRTGPIIPVNASPVDDLTSDQNMVVVWYETEAAGIGWPVNPVNYNCKWPDPADGTIIIASGNGSGTLEEHEYTGQIYYQPDQNKPGYNPNEEHALIMGSTVYALRNDLNNWEEKPTSEPYVLLKYKDLDGQWAMKVFKVEATDEEHDFNYPVVAGSPIIPLTPMDLLPQPDGSGIKEDNENGKAWYHEDHKGGHWAKAAADRVNYPVGNTPRSIAAEDLNGDGDLDLVVVNDDNDNVSVLLGKGDGTFAAKTDYPVGENPQSLAVQNYDTDGSLDLIVWYLEDTGVVSVLLGKGDGTFAAKTDYLSVEQPPLKQLSVSGDFDNNNESDRAEVHPANDLVTIQLNGTDPTSQIVMHWYYPLQKGFFYPPDPARNEGDVVPFMTYAPENPDANQGKKPLDVTYTVGWPSDAPVLAVGETLTEAKYGLPEVVNWEAGQVIFDENVHKEGGPLAKLFDPFTGRSVDLEELPPGITTENVGGKLIFPELPYSLRSRLFYDPANKRLKFIGISSDPGMGEGFTLPSIMTLHEKEALRKFFGPSGSTEIDDLFNKTRNPNGVTLDTTEVIDPFDDTRTYTSTDWQKMWGIFLGLEHERDEEGNKAKNSKGYYILKPHKLIGLPMALTAGMAAGEGYVVLAENDDDSLGAAPVQLHVIRVAGGPYQGEIKVIKSDNPFDEKLTLRHSGDFGGEPEKLYFAWYYKPDQTGLPPGLPAGSTETDSGGWVFHEEGPGLIDITIKGAGKLTLSDNWFMVHYYYGKQPPESLDPAYPSLAENSDPTNITDIKKDKNNWSDWAGSPGGDTAQLAEGWIKRVVSDLNPLDARVKDFRNYETSTDVSMIGQLGPRYEGDIALNAAPDNLNNLGLIEAYQTVLERGKQFSIYNGDDYGPANNALLNAATRIADFYTLLGNEAYADALDPTIGFDTKSGEVGSMASSLFAFQNQVDSLLEEELVLLRGRDDTMSTTRARPVYNRIIWNLTDGNGELAYVQTYNIFDWNVSGVIDELDAKVMHPQGHGDAWGHYLTGMKSWYELLRHDSFTWEPRPESVLVGGAPVPVDYADERKFAQTAAAKAKVGTEIVDLTYRKLYVEDTAGQWQGYKDTDVERAWGLDGWARRAAQGAYFDWVAANAMLPAQDPDPSHEGIRKIDRTTVPELHVIASHYSGIQVQMDEADQGLNPLGLARGSVPFDINPYQLTPSPYWVDAKTHFEQIYDRAKGALENAKTVFDYATDYTLRLRSNQDARADFKRSVEEQERAYWNQLIEIFGYPYEGDIGPGGSYAAGYDGPDWIHFMYMDLPDLTGEPLYNEKVAYTATFDFSVTDFDRLLSFSEKMVHQKIDGQEKVVDITYHIDPDSPWLEPPAGWGKRRAPGEIQMTLADLIKAHASYKQGLSELEGIFGVINAAVQTIEAKHGVSADQILVLDELDTEITNLRQEIFKRRQLEVALRRVAESGYEIACGVADGIATGHKLIGWAVGSIKTTAATIKGLLLMGANIVEVQQLARENGIGFKERWADRKLLVHDARFEVQQMVKELETMESDARAKLQELYMLREAILQAMGRYQAVLAKGERLLGDRELFRKRTAAVIQDYRYQDMGFRVFRNDAVEKYRATFDLAARYASLAARAYDYETNLLGSDPDSGQAFLTDIVKQRSPGVIMGGVPVAGRRGLADPLARLSRNFEVYKGQLGFNNPQIETNRFSLRNELFRIASSSTSAWQNTLGSYTQDDLWDNPNFKRYCRPFAPESMGPQPGIVIPFSTQVVFGHNYFGWPLGGGDSAYDPSNFATKVRSVGVWFEGYDTANLSSTPRVYLVPVGADVLRSPSGDGFLARQWNVVDQKLPVPFPIAESEAAEEDWIPIHDTLSEDFGGIRRFSSFRAYPEISSPTREDEIIAAETTWDSRLIGRSVWNTQWLLIIPGGTLHNDPNTGMDGFIGTVDDIKLFFHTYAYSGN